MNKLSTRDLEYIFHKIIQKLDKEKVKEINIEDDFYRIIPTDKWDSYEENIADVGSLFDDVESLKLLIQEDERPCSYVDFDRISSVLRYISQKNNPV